MASNRKELRCIIASCLALLALSVANVKCDFYTSTHKMRLLVTTEGYLVKAFDEYFQKVQRTNEQIKRFLEEVESNLKKIEENPLNYYKNPLNALKTIKRIAVDWKKMEQIVLQDHDTKANLNDMDVLGYANTTIDELVGASYAIVRLQRTYNLKTSDFANGVLMKHAYDTKFSANDCFELGVALYNEKNYEYSSKWLLQARVLLYEELNKEATDGALNLKFTKDFPHLRDAEVLELLTESLFHVGNYKMAHVLNKELLAQQPTNEYGLQNMERYRSHVLVDRSTFTALKKTPSESEDLTSKLEEHTNAICRGDVQQTPAERRNLRCRYVSNKVPYCLIAPFKMEELSHDPFVATYHDVMYESEIQRIINETEHHIKRSMIGATTKQKTEGRTSQTAWLDYKVLDSLYRRLQHITGLDLHYGEDFQVVNYGIGGHYFGHYDFVENSDEVFPVWGNRILTALLYMTDVQMGGATAFSFLNLAVPPLKGSLLFWFNLHESLEPDYRMYHSACPVLVGSKWICNEWFHQLGQEFKRPCSLQPRGHISFPYRARAGSF